MIILWNNTYAKVIKPTCRKNWRNQRVFIPFSSSVWDMDRHKFLGSRNKKARGSKQQHPQDPLCPPVVLIPAHWLPEPCWSCLPAQWFSCSLHCGCSHACWDKIRGLLRESFLSLWGSDRVSVYIRSCKIFSSPYMTPCGCLVRVIKAK